MTRYLVLWRQNPAATPTGPSEALKLNEMMFAGVENLMESGEVEEFGFFTDGRSGYAIGKGEATDIVRSVWSFAPFILMEVHEIIPWEKGKEITMGLIKAMIEAAKK